MNILAIDTSNLPLSIAVVTEERVLSEWTSSVMRNHSERLMPLLESMLREAGLKPKDIDLIAVAQGPGSYTGVRIGVTTAKTMAWALQKPLVGVSSLMALAYQIPYFPGIIVPMFDARRARVFTAGYRWNDGSLTEVIQEQILHLRDLSELLLKTGEPVLFLGDDVRIYQDDLRDSLGELAQFPSPIYRLPRAASIAWLGMLRYMQGKEETLTFAPQYLQPTEAEVRFAGNEKG